MRAAKALIVAVALAGLTLCSMGCSTMRISMNPKVQPADLANRHIPYKVALLMDNEFQNYHYFGTSGAEMSKLDYDLGSASKSVFMEAFMVVSKAVTFVEARPPYADPNRSDIAIVIQPRITGFNESHSAFLRLADYHANISYHVWVYDKTGRTVLDKDYSTFGVVQGQATQSPGSNYAAPAEVAMSQAVVALIDDIIRLNLPPQ
jgi:hypothetical protein